jgi:hypothetical protein
MTEQCERSLFSLPTLYFPPPRIVSSHLALQVAWEVKEEDAGGSSSGVFDYSMPDLVHPWEMLEVGAFTFDLMGLIRSSSLG